MLELCQLRRQLTGFIFILAKNGFTPGQFCQVSIAIRVKRRLLLRSAFQSGIALPRCSFRIRERRFISETALGVFCFNSFFFRIPSQLPRVGGGWDNFLGGRGILDAQPHNHDQDDENPDHVGDVQGRGLKQAEAAANGEERTLRSLAILLDEINRGDAAAGRDRAFLERLAEIRAVVPNHAVMIGAATNNSPWIPPEFDPPRDPLNTDDTSTFEAHTIDDDEHALAHDGGEK